MKSDIKEMSLEELENVLADMNQPGYRAKQLYEWIHTHNASSYEDMTNLPKTLRQQLADSYPMESSRILQKHEADDGAVKYLIEFKDGSLAEMVAISDMDDSGRERITACISSQIGCPLECAFCATGRQGFMRDLTADEIVSQVVLMKKDKGRRIDNVVVMGQGEPFLNYDNVIHALRRINKDKGIGIGARHITISTSGITDGIYDLIDVPEQFRLAISLHSADQTTRNMLMPRLSGQPLHSLKKALKSYCALKGRRVTIEYMLIDGVNDSEDQLDRLIAFCEGLNVHVNLLRFNKFKGSEFNTSSEDVIDYWLQILNSDGITASLRNSKGSDVAGACGQLAVDIIQD